MRQYLFIIIAVYVLEFGSYMQVLITFTAQARTIICVCCRLLSDVSGGVYEYILIKSEFIFCLLLDSKAY